MAVPTRPGPPARGSGSRPIRVLYVTHVATRSGNAASLRLLLSHLPPGAVEPYLLCPPGDAVPDFEAAGATVLTIPGISIFQSTVGVPLRGRRLITLVREIWNLRHGRRIRQMLRDLEPDLVHLNERGLFQVARVAHRVGIPVVMHARSVADRETRWVHRLFVRWTNRYVDQVIAIDESVHRSLRETRRCEVVYNPLNLAMLEVNPSPSGDPGRTRVNFMNTLLGYKGIWDLLEAARLLRNRTDIVFQIAGGNSRSKAFLKSPVGRLVQLVGLAADMEQRVADWIAREGLGDTVRLLGHVDCPEVVLGAADILVFPSHLNGVGRSVFEAGVMGVPSIVTLRDRVEDIVQDGVTGIVLPERDPRALAEAIRRMADDPKGRRAMGLRAREKYLAQFDPTAIGRRVLALYEGLVAELSPAG